MRKNLLFLKKKKQKDFYFLVHVGRRLTLQEMKVFWFFFSKKNIFAFVLLASGPALANSACDKPHNDFDGLYCLNKVYQQADTDLNAAYTALRGKLDGAGRDALRSGQLAWIQHRNDTCSKREGNEFYVSLNCATTTTVWRAEFLQARYRECISSGCQNSKLQ
jgi:uncharacterized protein YecT (DUF1311 family)